MKLTNKHIVDVVSKSDSLLSKRLPVKIAFALGVNYRSLKTYADVYQEEVNKLVMTYGQKKEDGSLNIEPDGSIPFIDQQASVDYRTAMAELDNMENEIRIITIKMEDIEQLQDESKYDVFTPEDFIAIDYMIEDL